MWFVLAEEQEMIVTTVPSLVENEVDRRIQGSALRGGPKGRVCTPSPKNAFRSGMAARRIRCPFK
jgi:hypothetical protein